MRSAVFGAGNAVLGARGGRRGGQGGREDGAELGLKEGDFSRETRGRSPVAVPVGHGEYFEVLRARCVGEGQERVRQGETQPEKFSDASGAPWARREGFKPRTHMVKVGVAGKDGLGGGGRGRARRCGPSLRAYDACRKLGPQQPAFRGHWPRTNIELVSHRPSAIPDRTPRSPPRAALGLPYLG